MENRFESRFINKKREVVSASGYNTDYARVVIDRIYDNYFQTRDARPDDLEDKSMLVGLGLTEFSEPEREYLERMETAQFEMDFLIRGDAAFDRRFPSLLEDISRVVRNIFNRNKKMEGVLI